MNEDSKKAEASNRIGRVTQEYEVLHEVAKALHSSDGLEPMLKKVLEIITTFEELKVELKAGIFLADGEEKVLRLFTTVGKFSSEFLDKEKEVSFGDCLCGRAAASGDLLMSNSCFTDPRHERSFTDMTAHGHYIVPLKSRDKMVGVMFLYTNIYPSWYPHSQEVLLSIGGLIADAIEKTRAEEELLKYRDHLEKLVETRTAGLREANENLKNEIQERKNAEREMKKFREQLRNLGNRLQNIREEEKSRIAREIHDDLGQSLTALKMELFLLENTVAREHSDIQAKTRAMSSLLDDTVKSVQQIAMELRPPILDAFGLCETIAWQAGEYKKRTGLEFDLNCLPDSMNIDSDRSTTLFRIFQETLTNIVRHSGAKRVEVSMDQLDGKLVLVVRDNGRGIEENQITDSKSLGLLGMRERALLWNGEFDIRGTPGKGTTVTVKIPFDEP